MQAFQYFMPTKIFFGPILGYATAFAGDENGRYGQRALIITGKSSAKNGALNDVLQVLAQNNIQAEIFDRVEENPSVENVMEAVAVCRACAAELIVAIGGGSPLDAAKAVALLAPNPDKTEDDLYNTTPIPKRLPLLAIPTTAGTGSEVTPYAVLTVHKTQTKLAISHMVFPEKAFLDAKYMAHLSDAITVSTAVDALAHLVEGYLSSRAGLLSDQLAEGGLSTFGGLLPVLMEKRFDEAVRHTLLITSSLAGMVISQTKTALPHQLSYALTYHKKIPHGAACGILLAEYMRFHPQPEKAARILTLLGLPDIDAMKQYLQGLLASINIHVTATAEEIKDFASALYSNPDKLKVHPGSVTLSDLESIYTNSLS